MRACCGNILLWSGVGWYETVWSHNCASTECKEINVSDPVRHCRACWYISWQLLDWSQHVLHATIYVQFMYVLYPLCQSTGISGT